jgi:monoamine oxidase
VQLSCVAKKIVRTGSGVTVQYLRHGQLHELTARRVVIAMSPPLSAKIEVVPGLSFERRQLCAAMEMGKVVKVLVAFKTPFWREDGLSGEFISDIGPLAGKHIVVKLSCKIDRICCCFFSGI